MFQITVNKLVKTLAKTATRLDHLAECKRREGEEIEAELDRLYEKRDEVDNEMDRALRVSDKLRSLLE